MNHFGRILRQEQVTPDLEWHTPEACVFAANRVGAPIVWLGDTEPLFHPNIGRVVSALLQSGRYVFLHTSGFGLRKRIHEFQPHSRLFITIEVPNDENAGHLALPAQSASRHFLEALDAARLSGFYRCAHITVDTQTDAANTPRWFEWLHGKAVEGFVTSSSNSQEIAADPALSSNLAKIRNLIPSRGWRDFSRMLEKARHISLEPNRIKSIQADREPLHPSNGICEENALSQ